MARDTTNHGSTTDGDDPDHPRGSDWTRRFYDERGWAEVDGQFGDLELFGTKEDGPIRIELHRLFQQRAHDAVAAAGTGLDLLECGCGGSPALNLLDLCASYTGVDFSETGLKQAERKLRTADVAHHLERADVCELPFEDGRFDAVYSARMIYHIPDAAAQARAVAEMLRVTRPGGVVVIITANPYPILFPERTAKRIVARAPVIGPLANRLRPPPPLPYEPMSLPWFKRQIGGKGSVALISNGMPSTAFNQRVSEYRGLGKRLWEGVRWLEQTHPGAAVWLGNYTQINVTKY